MTIGTLRPVRRLPTFIRVDEFDGADMVKPVKLPFTAAMVAVAILAAPAAQAQSDKKDPEQLLEEGTRTILRAFELFIQTIPQYEMPEVMPNGDIIIRHKPPRGDDGKPHDKPADGENKTKT
ncbi:MAG: hypothetical protein VW268_10090 [Rhodospirillaceae bacterium]